MYKIRKGEGCVLKMHITTTRDIREAESIVGYLYYQGNAVQANGLFFDEIEQIVYIRLTSEELAKVGTYSIEVAVRFNEEHSLYTPIYAFAEVAEDVRPSDTEVEIEIFVDGEDVTITPPPVTPEGGNVYTDEDKALVATIPELTRDVASKMPGTPSGDAQHYVYESAGARWNADTGYWEFYDMKDITNAEMARAFARGSWYMGAAAIGVLAAPNEQSSSAVRFNIGRTGLWSVTVDMDYFAEGNSFIEFINLTFDNNLVSQPFTYVTYLQNSFAGCSNLRRIYGEMNVLNVTKLATPFTGCEKLEDVEIYGLNKDISFADSPLLLKKSLLYMIDNCDSNAAFTITLHPDVYAKCQAEWLEDIDKALGQAEAGKQTNITLARA